MKNLSKLLVIWLFALMANIVSLGIAFGASITVISPNGGETLRKDTTATLQWSSSDITGNVRVLLRKGTGPYSDLTGPAGVPNTGSFSWVISEVVQSGADYKIDVRNLDGTVRDESNAFFSIHARAQGRRAEPPSPPPPGPPSIRVVAPNGGEELRRGSVSSIRWNRSGFSGNLRITLIKATGYTKELTGAGGFYHSSGNFPFSVTNDIPTGEDYRIVISNMDGAVRDESDAFFTIKIPPATEGHAFNPGGQQYDFRVADIFKDGTGIKARIVASETFTPPDYVEVSSSWTGTQRHIIRAGANDIVVGEMPVVQLGNSARMTVMVDPNDRFRETDEGNNSMQKDIWYADVRGEASINGNNASGGTVRVPCSQSAIVHLRLKNTGGLPVEEWDQKVTIHQSGRRPGGYRGTLGGQEYTDRILTARSFYGGQNCIQRIIPALPLQPGDCGVIRLDTSDLTQADSVLTFTFSGVLASWLIPNPMTISLDFGSQAIGGGCVY